MNFKSIIQSKVTKNASWLIGGRVYNMVLNFIVGLLTARYLGPGNYGLINYAATYTTFFASFCTLGINSVIVKNFVDHPDEEGETIGSAILLRTVSSFLSLLMMLCITMFADKGETTTHLVVGLCGIGVIFQVMDTLNYWFQSRLQSKYATYATMISYTIVSAYKVWLLVTEKNVEWFAVSTSIDYLVVSIVLFIMYRKHSGPKISFSKRKARELLQSSYHFILAGLMVSIYGSTDKFMLKQMLSEADVGYYSTAVSICNTWVFVLAAIIDSLYPTILQAFENKKLFERKNRQLYMIVFYVSFIVSAGFSILANVIIRILYGSAYLPAAMPLRIITWYTAFSYLGVARNAWIVSYNHQKYLKYLYIGAAITNVILNAIVIPHWGASGAAAASLVTQISTIMVFPVLIKELRPNVKLMLEAIRFKDVF
jgi:O-antigen/teichoic acid export membrane protein